MIRLKRLVVSLLVIAVVIGFTLITTFTKTVFVSEMRKHEVLSNAHAQFDIIINSYMRSGSSFMGRLLTSNQETFYWYEPLWNLDSGVYYWGKQYICAGYNICGIARNKTRHNIERVYSTIDDIFTCNLSNLETAVAEPMTSDLSGDSWVGYQICRKRNEPISACLIEMEPACSRSRHRAIKTVRLTVDNLEHFLDKYTNMKVIHLIRDPRAIMNSRITTTWFNIHDTTYGSRKTAEKDAEDLCSRIMHDIKEGITLKRKFPDRFAFVMFEDLLSSLRSNTEILYSYLGIQKSNLDKVVATMADVINDGEHNVRRIGHNYIDWWRFNLKFKSLNIIDGVCKNVTDLLGYKIFETTKDRFNSSIKSFDFNKVLLIENIVKHSTYDSVFGFS